MAKKYNNATTSDMPVDSSDASVEQVKPKKSPAPKPKINAIGKSTQAKTKSTAFAKSKSQTKSTSTKSNKTQQSAQVDKKLRTKLTNSQEEINDLEKLNEENLHNYRLKNKRNKVIIVLLSVMLAIAIAAIAIYIAITKLETNCNMYVHGVEATYIIEGEEMNKFRTPSNLQGNRVLRFEVDLKIKDDGKYNVVIDPKCYEHGKLIDNTLLYEHNASLFYQGGDGKFYSVEPISGKQTIEVCKGIIIDYNYEDTLNVDNFRLDFHMYFEKV